MFDDDDEDRAAFVIVLLLASRSSVVELGFRNCGCEWEWGRRVVDSETSTSSASSASVLGFELTLDWSGRGSVVVVPAFESRCGISWEQSAFSGWVTAASAIV